MAAVGFGGVPIVRAHETRPAIVTVTLDRSGVGEVEISLEIEALLSGPSHGEGVETTGAYKVRRALEPDALRREFERVSARTLSGFSLRFDGVVAPLRLRALHVPAVGDVALPRVSKLHFDTTVPPRATSVSWLTPAALGASVVRILEKPHGRVLFAGLLGEAQASPDVEIGIGNGRALGFGHYLVLGFEHILPGGPDHILFVIGLFLLNAGLKSLLWQVSAFTLAHSLTLALGIYGILQVPPWIVEPMIAASIIFVAVENLLTNRLSRWRPAVIFVFGLVHGLGFAGVLSAVGLPREDFISALIGFNIGVEIGQIAVLIGCFLTIDIWLRDRGWGRTAISKAGSVVIACIGAFWFVARVT